MEITEIEIFKVLLLINITSLFYYAFDYIPRLEKETEEAYLRIRLLKEIKKKYNFVNKTNDAIDANKILIGVYSSEWTRSSMWIGLALLLLPLLCILLCIGCYGRIPAFETSLSLAFGLLLVILIMIICAIRKRSTKKHLRTWGCIIALIILWVSLAIGIYYGKIPTFVRLWSLALFLAIIIVLVTVIRAMFGKRKRPTLKYFQLKKKAFEQSPETLFEIEKKNPR